MSRPRPDDDARRLRLPRPAAGRAAPRAHPAPPARRPPGCRRGRHRHVLVAIVLNRPGVLNRVASLMRARNFNIESLAVSHTDRARHQPDDDHAARRRRRRRAGDQAALPADRRPQGPGRHRASRRVEHELALIKVRATDRNRVEVVKIVELYKGRVVDLAADSVIVEATGTEAEVDALVALVRRLRDQGAGPDRHDRDGRAGPQIVIEEALKQVTATMYYDDDADPSALQGQTVAIIGYGSQGHAHALNLHESGVDGRRRAGAGPARAGRSPRRPGLEVADVADAVTRADVIMIARARTRPRRPSTTRRSRPTCGRASCSCSPTASTSTSAGSTRRPASTSGWSRPKGPGHLVRSVYQAGGGVPALFAVASRRDRHGARPDAGLRPRARRDARRRPRDDVQGRDRDRPVRRAVRPLRRHVGPREDGVRDARRGRLPAGARLLRDAPRAQADRGPDVPRRPQLHALQRERHGRVRRLRVRARGSSTSTRATIDAAASCATSRTARSPATGSPRTTAAGRTSSGCASRTATTRSSRSAPSSARQMAFLNPVVVAPARRRPRPAAERSRRHRRADAR